MESANHHLATITKLSQGKSTDIELLIKFWWGICIYIILMYLPTKYTLIANGKEHLLVGKIGKWWKWTRGGLGQVGIIYHLTGDSEKDTVITSVSSYWDILANYVLVAQLCPTLWEPMDCSPQVSFVHEIIQARILQWVDMSSPGDLPDPRI